MRFITNQPLQSIESLWPQLEEVKKCKEDYPAYRVLTMNLLEHRVLPTTDDESQALLNLLLNPAFSADGPAIIQSVIKRLELYRDMQAHELYQLEKDMLSRNALINPHYRCPFPVVNEVDSETLPELFVGSLFMASSSNGADAYLVHHPVPTASAAT